MQILQRKECEHVACHFDCMGKHLHPMGKEADTATGGQVQMELGKKKDKVSSLLVDYVVQV